MVPEEFLGNLLAKAGITINGNRAWDVLVRDPRAYARVMRDGTIGFGESFMAGWLDCERVDQMVDRAYRAELTKKFEVWRWAIVQAIKATLIPYGSLSRSFDIGERHYDTGNDLFEIMLDKYLIYSCGYWQNAQTLDAAQRDKLDLICNKLELKPDCEYSTLVAGGAGWHATLRNIMASV